MHRLHPSPGLALDRVRPLRLAALLVGALALGSGTAMAATPAPADKPAKSKPAQPAKSGQAAKPAQPGKPNTTDLAKEPSKMPTESKTNQPAGPLEFTVKDIDGNERKLSDYRGKVVMIVNVASKCGLTPQYAALQKQYEKHKDEGFVILGFPANNFNHQEPGTDQQIKEFCTGKYDVTFPMMSKISVAGDDKAPLYKFLTEPATAGDFGGEVAWNFGKFLIDRNGHLYARFAPKTPPDDPKVTAAIEAGIKARPAEAPKQK